MGVGFPQNYRLLEFGEEVWHAFGHIPYHVGSSLTKKRGWRDVDVRLLLPDEEWEAMELGDPTQRTGINPKWLSLCRAFTALGREMTDLPIDFQIQQVSYANESEQGKSRSALYAFHRRDYPEQRE